MCPETFKLVQTGVSTCPRDLVFLFLFLLTLSFQGLVRNLTVRDKLSNNPHKDTERLCNLAPLLLMLVGNARTCKSSTPALSLWARLHFRWCGDIGKVAVTLLIIATLHPMCNEQNHLGPGPKTCLC